MSLINIDIIKNKKFGHDDLVFEIPKLINPKKFDTYYFAIEIEEIKNAEIKCLRYTATQI